MFLKQVLGVFFLKKTIIVNTIEFIKFKADKPSKIYIYISSGSVKITKQKKNENSNIISKSWNKIFKWLS